MACHLGHRPDDGLKSLEGLCLYIIASNFERYLATLKQQNSSVPRHHLEFLKKHYSERLFSSVSFYQIITHEHMDFFLNPYMRELDVTFIHPSNQGYLLDDIATKLENFSKNIVSLKMWLQEKIEYPCIRLISLMPNLEKIDFWNRFSFEPSRRNENFCTSVMKTASKELRKQVLCFPTPGIIKEIGNSCPLLKVLKFPNHLDMSWGFEDLYREDVHAVCTIMRQCAQLEVLDFPDTVGVLYEMHKNDLKTMKDGDLKCKKYVLKTLSAQGGYYPLPDALKLCAALCPYVSHLNIRSLESDIELEQCFQFEHLEDVTFKCVTGIAPDHLNQFLIQRGKKLINLELHCTPHLSILTLIQSCPKLQSLVLHGVANIYELPCKGELPSLRRLEFVGTDFTGGIISTLKFILSAGRGIETLSLTECDGLSSELFDNMDLSHIRELKIRDSEVSGHSLMKLLHGGIQKVEICDCLNYKDRLKLRSFRAVTIVCRSCELIKISSSKLFTKCVDCCEWCRLDLPFW